MYANYDARPPAADAQHQVWTIAKATTYAFLVETETEFQPSFERAQNEAEVTAVHIRMRARGADGTDAIARAFSCRPPHVVGVVACVAADAGVPRAHDPAVGPHHWPRRSAGRGRDPRDVADRPVCLQLGSGLWPLQPLPSGRCVRNA